MNLVSVALVLAAQAPLDVPTPVPGATPPDQPVILFLMDNSASLPPLDPDQKRVAALGKMFTFLHGQPFRLVLFGARDEIAIDDLSSYRNDGKWTDFYNAFAAARALTAGYPEGTEFRFVLLTDGISDPSPDDWKELGLPAGDELRARVGERTLELLRESGIPLYVVLVGQLPKRDEVTGTELAPQFVLDMVAAANGRAATPLAQTLSSFVAEDGVLFKKFVFRVAPYEGLRRLEPIIRRIVTPAGPLVELEILGILVVPLSLFTLLLLGILVRSFPGPGDAEIVELAKDQPVHVAVDRLHRIDEGWAPTGLSLVAGPKEAAATFSYVASPIDFSGEGIDAAGLDEATEKLLRASLDDTRRLLADMAASGSKDQKIHALNLDYMAKNLDPAEAERVLATSGEARAGVPALDFVRAKVHLLFDDALRQRLTAPRVRLAVRGDSTPPRDVAPGARVRIGRYGFIVQAIERGGRKDARLVLYYDHVPSLAGLKTWLPERLQRAIRMRRSQLRLVS